MKKLLLLTTFILVSAFGCQKYEYQNDSNQDKITEMDSLSVELIRKVDSTFTIDMYKSVKKSKNPTYGISDLLSFLGSYGMITNDITPAFGNYNQDITGGGSYLGQLSLVNGENMFNINEPIIDTLNYDFEWHLNGEFITDISNPKVYNFSNIECDGVMELTLSIKDLNSGAVFSRTEWSYFGFNNIEDCNCDFCPGQFDVFYEFYPTVDSYYYMTECANWDLDCNGMVALGDLMIFLANFNAEL
jgi:hypothetical protein